MLTDIILLFPSASYSVSVYSNSAFPLKLINVILDYKPDVFVQCLKHA